jgi:phospholipase/lecithinase/hemolysin
MNQAPVLKKQISDQKAKSSSLFKFTFSQDTFYDPDIILNPLPGLIVFGDSLSDTGNIYKATQETIPPPPYFEGRFSNGLLWIDYLKHQLQLTSESLINFAFAGGNSGISRFLPELNANVPGLLTQVALFQDFNKINRISADTLYTIWIGSNDFLLLPPDADYIKAGRDAATNIGNAITILINEGAKQFVVANLINLGDLPVSINNAITTQGEEFSLSFSGALTQTVNSLKSNADIDISIVDMFSLNENIQANPENFGLINLTVPLIQETGNVNPDEYAFWDTIHPTTKVHQILSQNFAQTLVEEKIIPDLITYSATLPNGNELPDWLKFNTATQTFEGTPSDGNVGELDIKVTATDHEGLTAIDVFSIVIENINPPVFFGTPNGDIKKAGVDLNGINNIIFTGSGNDEVDIPLGGNPAGNNRIATGSDNDIIFVGDRDRAFGGSGDDELDATDAISYRISGGSGDDIFYLGENGRALGGDGNDKFFVQDGLNNVITGGLGADQFWVVNGSLPISKNTITDFTIGVDKVGFGGVDILNFGQVIKEQVGSDTLLLGIKADNLTANDFAFSASVVSIQVA